MSDPLLQLPRTPRTGTLVAAIAIMKTSTKWMAVGAGVGAAAAAFGAARMVRRRSRARDVDSRFDASDVHDISEISDTTDVEVPMIITEEVVVISDPVSYDVDVDLIPSDDPRVRGR